MEDGKGEMILENLLVVLILVLENDREVLQKAHQELKYSLTKYPFVL